MSDQPTMSPSERARVTVMQSLKAHKLTQREAATRLGLSIRQVKRSWQIFKAAGSTGLISKQRGRVSPRRLDAELRNRASELIRSRYSDFGPTLAHEKLTELDHLQLSVESVRQIMIEQQLWQVRHAKRVMIHPLRPRRACLGELVQIDGSPFDWFEGRAPKCSLLVLIDDATSRLLELFLAPQESMFSYGAAMTRYLRRQGKPLALYSDKHSIFRVTAAHAVSGTGLTQFGRAMQDLDIQIICANSPQAKGRVERVNQTLQDRLTKELRLREISTLDAANDYLPTYLSDFNLRFAVIPRSAEDRHRPLGPTDNLERIFSHQESRTLSKNLTVQYNKVVYQVQTTRPTYALRSAPILVLENAQGAVTLEYQGKVLEHTVYDRQAHQSEIVSTKMLDAALATPRPPHIPAANHPWRNYGPATNSIALSPQAVSK
jgi:transposase